MNEFDRENAKAESDRKWNIGLGLLFGFLFMIGVGWGVYKFNPTAIEPLSNLVFRVVERVLPEYANDANQTDASMESASVVDPVSGLVEISTSPNADVTIDGVATSSNSVKLSAGSHQINVTKKGYLPINDVISIEKDGEVIKRSYVLQPAPLEIELELAPRDGLLTINGARAKLNGISRLNTPYKNQLVIKYMKLGFEEVKKTFNPEPGDVLYFKANLSPEIGKVELSGTQGATVKINGKLVGSLPVTLDLPTTEHAVEVSKEGYRAVKRKVKPKADRLQTLQFNLKSLRELKRASSPDLYKSSFGLEFKLIKAEGQSFQMGGKKTEKGRRANEIIRKIKFTKNFYVSTTELTQKQFGKGDNKPLTNTPWIDVAKFCNEASRKEKLKAFYLIKGDTVVGYNESADGYRIITEAEWEFLARKFNKIGQTIFVWGNRKKLPVGVGNLADQQSRNSLEMYIPGYNDKFVYLAPVKSFNALPRGLYDIVGNASEWVNDTYMLVPTNSGQVELNPLGRPGGATRTIKGSSYLSANLSELRAAFRDGTSGPRQDLGFRLARYM